MDYVALKLFAALSAYEFIFFLHLQSDYRAWRLFTIRLTNRENAIVYNPLQAKVNFFHCEMALGGLFFILIRQFDSPHVMNIHNALIL